jgi:hypothetical protein
VCIEQSKKEQELKTKEAEVKQLDHEFRMKMDSKVRDQEQAMKSELENGRVQVSCMCLRVTHVFA